MLYSTNTLILNKFNFFCFPLFCGFYALHAHMNIFCNYINNYKRCSFFRLFQQKRS